MPPAMLFLPEPVTTVAELGPPMKSSPLPPTTERPTLCAEAVTVVQAVTADDRVEGAAVCHHQHISTTPDQSARTRRGDGGITSQSGQSGLRPGNGYRQAAVRPDSGTEDQLIRSGARNGLRAGAADNGLAAPPRVTRSPSSSRRLLGPAASMVEVPGSVAIVPDPLAIIRSLPGAKDNR